MSQRSHKTVEIKVFFYSFCFIMEGSWSRSGSWSVQNNNGSGRFRNIRIRIHNTAHHYITEQKVHWQTGALATCHASPFVTYINFYFQDVYGNRDPCLKTRNSVWWREVVLFSLRHSTGKYTHYTNKKENQIFLINKKIQNGAVAKSCMTNGLLICGEIFAHFLIYKEGSPSSCMTLQLLHSEFPYIRGQFDFLFYQCTVEQCLVLDSKWRRNNLKEFV